MNVTVKGRQTADGSVNTASEGCLFCWHAEGPVDSVSFARINQVVVFGQVYQIDSRTVIEYHGLSTIKVGEIMMVKRNKKELTTYGSNNRIRAATRDDGNY